MNRALAIALALIAASPSQAAEKNFERTFQAAAGGALFVQSDSATVNVSGESSNQVTVRMSVRGSDEDVANTTLDAVQEGDSVKVILKRPARKSWFNWGGSWNGDGKVVVSVPRNHRIDVRTSGGSVGLENIAGAVILRTSGGDIVASDVGSTLEAHTSGGGIRAERIGGDVEAHTSGGDVQLFEVDGKIDASTSGGGIRASLVGANRGIATSTSGGSIELTLPRTTTGDVDASTSGGDVTCDLPVTATRTKENQLRGSINGGGKPITAHTSGGSIALRAAR